MIDLFLVDPIENNFHIDSSASETVEATVDDEFNSAFTLLLTCVTISNALAVEEQEPETKQTVLAVCFETSLLARELMENTHLADYIQNNTEKIALQVVVSPSPTYNGIIAGLNECCRHAWDSKR